VRCGTVLWLENPELTSSNGDDETSAFLSTFNKHCILRYTSISRCRKYFKRVRSYERIIIVIVINVVDNKSLFDVDDISRLCQYPQLQSILIVSPKNEDNGDGLICKIPKPQEDTTALISVFHDHQLMFTRLKQLLSKLEEVDDNYFLRFNKREKSLRDVRHELGISVWSHSYRGQFTC
jgi:hypothetical protein